MIKTRFAPSPTGFLHVGSLRTVLFDYFMAKKAGGTFMLRIEDTDQGRLVEGATESMVSVLARLGIVADEGVCMENNALSERGENGPYTQSKRLATYQEHMKKLLGAGHAYHCFCSKERLDELRTMQQKNKQPTGYDGRCKGLSEDDVAKKIASNESFVVRLRMPDDGETTFTDLVRGEVTFSNAELDDQVLMKADGFPTYHLAVVVDDHLMGVTHVVRGEEWVSSTPKHVQLYTMFGWDIPQFAHLPLLVNEKKQKLSKRHGDVAVEDFLTQGYLPEALLNFLAFLGWNPGDEREIMNLDELIEAFDIAQVSKSAAFFNREKLDWYNKQYMMNMDLDMLVERAIPFFEANGITAEEQLALIKSAVTLERSRAATLSDIVSNTTFMFASELTYDVSLLAWKKSTLEDAKEKLGELAEQLKSIGEGEWGEKTLEQQLSSWIDDTGYGKGDVLWPMRVALSGQKHSPGPFELAAALGKKRSLSRIKQAITA